MDANVKPEGNPRRMSTYELQNLKHLWNEHLQKNGEGVPHPSVSRVRVFFRGKSGEGPEPRTETLC